MATNDATTPPDLARARSLHAFVRGTDALAQRVLADASAGLGIPEPDEDPTAPAPEPPKKAFTPPRSAAIGKHRIFGTVYRGKRGGTYVMVKGERFYGKFTLMREGT